MRKLIIREKISRHGSTEKTEEVYVVDGVEYDGLLRALVALYGDQGNLYEALGIPREHAQRLGFHPEDTQFNRECTGFGKLLDEVGITDEKSLVDWLAKRGPLPLFSSEVKEKTIEMP